VLSIHNDRSVPCDRLLDWLPGHQQKTDTILPRLNDNLITVIKEYERTVVGLQGWCLVPPSYAFGRNRERSGSVAELSGPGENVSEGVAPCFYRECPPASGGTETSR
jgi:hypothetical protein